MDSNVTLFKNMTQAQRHEEFLEAAKEGGVSTVITLIEQGINVKVGNGFDTTALMFAAASNGHNNVAQVLFNAGATINAANLYGETALSFAVKNNHLGIVKILLQEKANVAITDLQGHSPLKYACQRNHREVAFYLLHAFSEQKIAPNFAHTLVDEYNKIKKDIFSISPDEVWKKISWRAQFQLYKTVIDWRMVAQTAVTVGMVAAIIAIRIFAGGGRLNRYPRSHGFARF